jgi:hypothetical protein
MKQFIVAVSFLLGAQAKADIIKCHFTEPFIDLEYSMTQSKLTRVNHGTTPAKTTVKKSVSFQIMPAWFELWDKHGNVLAAITLSNAGSDGMSDIVYPYEIEYTDPTFGVIWGGCTSNFLHSHASAP